MGYDILAKVIEYTDSEVELETRLRKVMHLVATHFPFDSTALYLVNGKTNQLRLAASCCSPGDFPETYGPGEGLAGLATGRASIVEAYSPEIQGTRFGRTEDRGLEGFQSALVIPLMDRSQVLGVMYLKALRKLSLTTKVMDTLNIISLQLSYSLKSENYALDLRGAYTRLSQTQTQLIQAEKLLAIAELSAALAHEIKNPLVSIGGFARRLQKKVGKKSPLYDYTETIVKEVERLEGLMEGILSIADHDAHTLSEEDANEVVKKAVGLFDEALKKHRVTVTTKLHPEKLPIYVDALEMNIAIDNIIANAIQSMDKGGTLTFITAADGDEVVIEISDSGGGIDPGLVGDIFNPFFTTKESGTGLGLAITHKIIRRHKGRIDVINDVGTGVTFSIKLPRHRD